jgi:nucleoside-diphosphate-sugar epimerase
MLTSGSALVCGAGGFIGHHLVRRLKQEGLWVVSISSIRGSATLPPMSF